MKTLKKLSNQLLEARYESPACDVSYIAVESGFDGSLTEAPEFNGGGDPENDL